MTSFAKAAGPAAVATPLLLWAGAFVVIRGVGDEFDPGALAFLRLLVGTAALGLIALRARRPFPRGRALGLILCYGLLWFAAYTVVLNWAEHHLDAGTAALLVNFAPVIVAVIAGVVFREGFPRSLVVGIVVSVIGVLIISLGSTGGGTSDALGVTLGLAAAVLYSSGVLLQKAALRSVEPITATWVGCAAGLLATTPFAGQAFGQVTSAPADDLLGIVFLGVGSTAIAFTSWAYALNRTDAGKMAATTLCVPAIAILMSWIALGEVPTRLGLLGGALALSGVAITRWPRPAARAPVAEPVLAAEPTSA